MRAPNRKGQKLDIQTALDESDDSDDDDNSENNVESNDEVLQLGTDSDVAEKGERVKATTVDQAVETTRKTARMAVCGGT